MISLEYRSFKNLIYFYAFELRKIKSGMKASQILSYSERRRLKKYGVLTIEYGLIKISLTEKAKKVLTKI